GGTGKTRLSLEVAAGLLDQFPDGIWLVELAPLADPALVPQTVAAALKIREVPGQSLLATITTNLRDRNLFIILDNCEHLLEACAHIVDAILRAAPQVKV